MIQRLLVTAFFILFALCACEKAGEKIVYKDKIVYVEVPAEAGGGAEDDAGGEADTDGDDTGGTDTGDTDGTALNDDGDDSPTVALTSVAFAGSLAIAGAGEAGQTFERTFTRSTVETYSLYCTTFEDEPQACSIAVTAAGALDGECDGFAGISFGCFLRQDDTTLTTVEFDGDSSLLTGSGELLVAIEYDATTKKATADVDTESSTALNTDAIEAAKAVAGVETTVIPDLTGDWKISCVEDAAAGFTCGMGGPKEPYLYLSQFAPEAGPKRLGLWTSKAARTQCVGDGSEAEPEFAVAFAANSSFAIDLTSGDSIAVSLDAAYAGMPAVLKTAVANSVKWESRFETQRCAFNPVRSGNCKLATIKDLETHGWDGTKYTQLTDVDGQTMTIKNISCTSDLAKAKEMPLCPPFVTATDGLGTIKEIFLSATQDHVFLVCDTGSPKLMAMPTPMEDLDDAITAVAGGSSQCTAIADASAFNGFTNIEREKIRGTILDLARQASFPDPTNIDRCTAFNKPAAFADDFRNCHLAPGYRVCQKLGEIGTQFDMVLGGGEALVAGGQNSIGVNPMDAGIMCPTARKAFFDPNDGDSNNPMAFATSCKAEIAALTAAQQVARITSHLLSMEPLPLLEKMACHIDTAAARDDFRSALRGNSCMPDIYPGEICDAKGNCRRGYRCQGSSEPGGKCYDDYGVFVGKLFQRRDLMKIRPGVNSAFELSNSFTDSWHRPDSNGGVKECKFGVTTVINSRMATDTEFSGIFQQTAFDSCHDDFAFAETDTTNDAGFSTDFLRNMRFEKCAAAACAGEIE